jgi:hypothetical protein
MTRTVRPHQVQQQAEDMFGPRLSKLENQVRFLIQRLAQVEKSVKMVNPQTADFEEVNNNPLVIGDAHASSSEGKEDSREKDG